MLKEATVAENPALVALAGTFTVAGTETTPSLLDRVTLWPPLGAAALRVTVQASVPAAVMVPLVQLSELSAAAVAVPVPLRLTTAEGLVEELLVMVNCPVAAPAVEGSNCKVSVAAWLGFNVTGNEAPDIVKPVPDSAAALMVTGAVPVDVNVSNFVEAMLTATLPKLMLVELALSAGTVAAVAFNCSEKLLELLFADAVKFTVCVEVTADTVALKLAVVALAATVTVTGTVTAPLSLLRLTLCPPLPAAPLKVTVQGTVPAPGMDPVLHENPLTVIAGVSADFFPTPCSLTAAVGLVVELLAIVTCPVDVVSVLGLKCTLKLIVLPAARVTGSVPCPSTENEVPDKVN